MAFLKFSFFLLKKLEKLSKNHIHLSVLMLLFKKIFSSCSLPSQTPWYKKIKNWKVSILKTRHVSIFLVSSWFPFLLCEHGGLMIWMLNCACCMRKEHFYIVLPFEKWLMFLSALLPCQVTTNINLFIIDTLHNRCGFRFISSKKLDLNVYIVCRRSDWPGQIWG